ncbi:hypothetical protein WJX77_002537 [Trebouxia sp. C0004]
MDIGPAVEEALLPLRLKACGFVVRKADSVLKEANVFLSLKDGHFHPNLETLQSHLGQGGNRLSRKIVKRLPYAKISREVQKDLEEFQEWAVKHGLPKQQVEVQKVPGQGRGLFATEKIRKGQQLLQIPDALLLTADKAAEECCIGSALKDAGMFDWTVLATYLVELRDQQEQSHASSYWAEYVALLPNNTGCILEWTAKEVHNLLAGSPLQKKAMDIQDAAEKSWREVQPVLQQAAVQGLIKPEAYTQRRYQWAFSILLTRMCRLPGRCNEEVLVAWGDMANHRSDVTSFLDWDRTKRQIVFQPDCSYDPGEQVYVSYGPKTSGELLLSYGFMLAPESNPNDAYLLEIALDEDDSQLQGKLAALQQYGLSARQQFPLKDSTFDTEDSSGSQVAQIERSIAAAVLRVRERQILHRTTFILKQSKR